LFDDIGANRRGISSKIRGDLLQQRVQGLTRNNHLPHDRGSFVQFEIAALGNVAQNCQAISIGFQKIVVRRENLIIGKPAALGF